ncbi:hypothetical protein [Thalassobacillus hwangdonensis]|uniref:BioF2-like acetyltransferase domain-containing protein n=1 Tax=Thalassobacillus hwangdonensis TaxID=546108 RepID=A0ABW3L6U0_9BACI
MLTYSYYRNAVKITERMGSGVAPNKGRTDLLMDMELLLSPIDKHKFVTKKKGICIVIPNYLIDLTNEEEEIYQNIKKNTKYKINRARNRDELNLVNLTAPSDNQIEAFTAFYNPFAKERDLRGCDEGKLKAIRDQGSLVMTYVTDQESRVLCYHVYQTDQHQAYLIYSASRRYANEENLDRNMIGRANRYLHWEDMRLFKSLGCAWYNFGGKVLNPDDKGGQNVNRFKLEFGTVEGYDARRYTSCSLLGKVVMFLFYMKWKNTHAYQFTISSQNLTSEA